MERVPERTAADGLAASARTSPLPPRDRLSKTDGEIVSQGYLPAPVTRRLSTLARKRSEYASLVRQAFSRGVKGLDGPLWHQISIDVPRTKPGVPLWQAEATQRSLERILYVWAIRHPASGYVQGINDLVTPFFQVFLANYIGASFLPFGA